MKMKMKAPSPRAVALSAFAKRPTPSALICQNRWREIHSSSPKEQDVLLSASAPTTSLSSPSASVEKVMSTLSCLPLTQILRTYFITSISSSPALLDASSALLRRMLESKGVLFNVERNPALRAVLLHTFYKQFCAGGSKPEITQLSADLRSQGYSGVILEYALEVLKEAKGNEIQDVAAWKNGMLGSVHMASEGDFIGLKWSGMGPAAMRLMAKDARPTRGMEDAMHAVCMAAVEKNVSLLPAAEETWSLDGYHSWSLNLQRVYNMNGKSVIYNTYQAYLKRTPGIVAQHLAMAKKENFNLGLKLVRGAYLASEERDVIFPTIEDTHHAYDGIASSLINRSHNDVVKPISAEDSKTWAGTHVVLATHNMASVENAKALRNLQARHGKPLTPLAFAQLQGMADEVSFNLIASAKAHAGNPNVVKEKVFKCTTWGTMTECLNYLLRRAAENKDAAARTADTRVAMQGEIWRRMKTSMGLA